MRLHDGAILIGIEILAQWANLIEIFSPTGELLLRLPEEVTKKVHRNLSARSRHKMVE